MQSICLRLVASVCLVLLSCSQVQCHYYREYDAASAAKPLAKRPEGVNFRTILSVDGGGVRALVSTRILMEVEQSIKEYLLSHPDYLPHDAYITSADDFDIHLADYFDCMTGISAGGWTTLYLASRGRAFKAVLEDPAIVEKYGVITPGTAEGLRVFYREYATVIYPPEAVNASAGEVGDLTNPLAPGVAAPLYGSAGLETAMEALFGDFTLADLDTSIFIPAFDLISGYTTYFVQNTFRDTPVTSSARLIPRVGPKTVFSPDIDFDEGSNYYLRDVGAGTGSVPVAQNAKPVSQVGDDTLKFLLIDAAIPVDVGCIPVSFFVVSENGLSGFEHLAIMSIGNGNVETESVPLANAGLAGWLDNFQLLFLYNAAGRPSQVGLMDYMFYANPATKPQQYLRIQLSAPQSSELGMALTPYDQPIFSDLYEEVGSANAVAHREAIDTFVKDFLFH